MRYVHNGIYIVSYGGYYGKTLVMHDLINNKEVNFSDVDNVMSCLDGEPEWDIYNVEGLFFATLITRHKEWAIVSLDFNNYAYYKTSIEFEYEDDIWWTGNDYEIYNTAIYIYDINDHDPSAGLSFQHDKGIYDVETQKFVEFVPQTNYNCDLVDYSNGYFLVTTKNENDTVFYTIIDWNMNPLFSPKRYKDTTTLLDDYLISDEDDGSVSITQISSMSIIKNISNSTVVYVDETSKYVWLNNSQETTECYNIETGDLLFSINVICNVYSDFNDGLALVENSTTGELMYVDVNGEQLKIVDNSI